MPSRVTFGSMSALHPPSWARLVFGSKSCVHQQFARDLPLELLGVESPEQEGFGEKGYFDVGADGDSDRYKILLLVTGKGSGKGGVRGELCYPVSNMREKVICGKNRVFAGSDTILNRG